MNETAMAVEALAALEDTATAQSLPYLTDREIDQARLMNIEMAEYAIRGNAEQYGILGHQLHELLYSRCRNSRLLHLVRCHAAQIRAAAEIYPVFNRANALQSVRDHDELLDRLRAGSLSEAEIATCSRAHRLRTVRTLLNDLLDQVEEFGADDVSELHAG